MFDVHVVDEDELGIEGVRVVLSFRGATRGQTDAVYTDADGHAEFDGYEDGAIEVYLNGDGYGRYDYEDGAGITIQMA